MKKICFIDGNRAINKNNVKKHVESLKKFGCNLVPLLYVEATEVEGHTLYDANTEEVIAPEDYKNYWAVLDGQHRYKAAKQLADSEDANGFTLDSLNWQKVELNGKSIEDVLIEVNTRTLPWKGVDYVSGTILHNPENEKARFAKELANNGLSAKTIGKYLFFSNKFKWSEAMADVSRLDDANLSRAQKIWDVIKEMPQKLKKSSIMIDWIIENGGNRHWEAEVDKLKKLKKDELEALSHSTAKDVKSSLEKLINE